MGMDSEYMYVLTCNGCEDNFEGDFGDIYYQFDHRLREEAVKAGWKFADETSRSAAWCLCRTEQHAYKDEREPWCSRCGVTRDLHPLQVDLSVEIPGQLALPIGSTS